MNSKEYTLPNGKKAVFEYDVCGIGKVTLECMDELMGMIADRPSGAWTPCTKNGLPLTELGRREGQTWYGYKCSECNFIYKGNALIESPFCQNCGCRMKGADDERHDDARRSNEYEQ